MKLYILSFCKSPAMPHEGLDYEEEIVGVFSNFEVTHKAI